MKKIQSVLIVDDEPGDVEIVSYYLRNSDAFNHVNHVQDGQAALELFQDPDAAKRKLENGFPPTLIILDINMPRMTGFEFLDALAELDGHGDAGAPVVVAMLTSSSFGGDLDQAKKYGVIKRYLTKPFTRAYAEELAEAFGEP